MNFSSILASGVLAAFISGAFNWYFKREDYRNEYKKYILEKRKKAYEEIETIISTFSATTYFVEGDSITLTSKLFCFDDQNRQPIANFLLEINQINNNKYWLSFEMRLLIFHINHFLTGANKIIQQRLEDRTNYYLQTTDEFYPRFTELKMAITKQFFMDLKSLTNVRKFQASKAN